MIGRLRLNSKVHTKAEQQIYKKYYCSICFALEERYGWIYKNLVSYDIAVAYMILCATEGFHEEQHRHCTVPPFRKQCCVLPDENSAFLADITILLVFYKALDDQHDEGKLTGRILSRLLKKQVEAIAQKDPELFRMVNTGMDTQWQYEKNDCKVSLMAACKPFSYMLAEIISCRVKDDLERETVKQLFFWIGSWIYLVDACEDVYKDRKRRSYNPITAGINKKTEEVLAERRVEMIETLGSIQRNIFMLLELFPQTEETAILKKLFGNNATKKLARILEVI